MRSCSTVKAKKETTEIIGAIGTGGYIQYATPEMREKAATMRGRVVAIKPKSKAKARVLDHHRKFFCVDTPRIRVLVSRRKPNQRTRVLHST